MKRLDSKSGAWRVTGVFLSQSGANYDDYHTGWDWESPSVYWFQVLALKAEACKRFANTE